MEIIDIDGNDVFEDIVQKINFKTQKKMETIDML